MASKKCLLVDDQEDVLNVVSRVLARHCNLQISAAHNAIEALTLLENASFDILVTDENMPGLPGSALLRTAKNRWPLMRRVLLSADVTSEHIRSGVADAILDKIFNPNLIATKICRLANS